MFLLHLRFVHESRSDKVKPCKLSALSCCPLWAGLDGLCGVQFELRVGVGVGVGFDSSPRRVHARGLYGLAFKQQRPTRVGFSQRRILIGSFSLGHQVSEFSLHHAATLIACYRQLGILGIASGEQHMPVSKDVFVPCFERTAVFRMVPTTMHLYTRSARSIWYSGRLRTRLGSWGPLVWISGPRSLD